MIRRAFSLIEVIIVTAIIGILLGLVLAAVQSARNAAARLSCANNLRQLGIGLHGYHDSYQSFPPAVCHPRFYFHPFSPDTDPYPQLNWHARLLPFIEQDALWALVQEGYEKDPVMVSAPPHNAALITVPLFICPADDPQPRPRHSTRGTTSYLGVSGLEGTWTTDGVLFLDSQVRMSAITDGTSQTLMAGERPPAFFWPPRGRWYGGSGSWGPTDAYLGVRETIYGTIDFCDHGPYHFKAGNPYNPCSAYHYWSFHPGGANFLFADGSVQFLPYSADGVLPLLATKAGGEVAPSDD